MQEHQGVVNKKRRIFKIVLSFFIPLANSTTTREKRRHCRKMGDIHTKKSPRTNAISLITQRHQLGSIINKFKQFIKPHTLS